MPIGPKRHPPEWEDMSNFVVHFTKTTREQTSAYNMASILRTARIEARSKFGIGKDHDAAPHAVCLSETPLHLLARISRRRGRYGLGFEKEFVVSKHGGPIFYSYGDHARAAYQLMERADPDDPFWTLAPFIDYVSSNYSFDWEREWRVPFGLPFTPDDVRFLIFPEDEHDRVKVWLVSEHEDGNMPLYEGCPLIDDTWPADRIGEILDASE